MRVGVSKGNSAPPSMSNQPSQQLFPLINCWSQHNQLDLLSTGQDLLSKGDFDAEDLSLVGLCQQPLSGSLTDLPGGPPTSGNSDDKKVQRVCVCQCSISGNLYVWQSPALATVSGGFILRTE